jgi:ribonuclease-3
MKKHSDEDLRQLQAQLGMTFANVALLKQALTHSSFSNESDDGDNERMEFLGDALLDYMTADFLYRKFPDLSEGELTQLRSALVRAESLAQLARELSLDALMVMGKGEDLQNERKRTNVLCRAFEALVGAIYLDKGMEAARAFALPRLEQLLAYLLENDLYRDARSLLLEKVQAELLITPSYHLLEVVGPAHERMFHMEVRVGDVVIGRGLGASKRGGSQAAARNALERFTQQGGWSAEAVAYAQAHQPPPKPPKPRKARAQGRDDA